MTAMPQMVALVNGVGGGAVALIAWIEYRHHFAPHGGTLWALKVEIPSLFAAIVGSLDDDRDAADGGAGQRRGRRRGGPDRVDRVPPSLRPPRRYSVGAEGRDPLVVRGDRG